MQLLVSRYLNGLVEVLEISTGSKFLKSNRMIMTYDQIKRHLILMGNRFPSQVSDFVCNEEVIQFDKDNQGPDRLAVGGMISDELLSRTKPV